MKTLKPTSSIGQIQAILFDKDGTLIDLTQSWEPILFASTALIVSHAQNGITEEQLLLAGGYEKHSKTWRPNAPLAVSSIEDVLTDWSVLTGFNIQEKLGSALSALSSQAPQHAVATVDNIQALMEALSSQFVLGVASMDNEANVLGTNKALNIDQFIAFNCGADSGFGLKPEAGMVRAFSQATGVSAAQILVVGDALKDVKMAKNAGAIACGVCSGANNRQDLLPYSDWVIDNIDELKILVENTI